MSIKSNQQNEIKMIKSTKIKALFLLLSLTATLKSINIDNLLNNVIPEETVQEMATEGHTNANNGQNDADYDPEEPVSITNDNNYTDDEPIELPWIFTDEYKPQGEKKYSSVKEYWEKEILFMKWDASKAKPMFAMDTEKPVYKPGEVVRVTIFFYDRFNFKPLSFKEVNCQTPSLKLMDANRKTLQTLDLSKHIDSESASSSFPKFKIQSSKVSMVVEFKLDEEFAGGFYTWEFTGESFNYKEKTDFFVSAYRNVKEAIVLDFNKDALLPGDDVMAKVTLKLLGNEAIQSNDAALQFTYKVVDDSGKELESKTKSMVNKAGYIMYRTPSDLGTVRSLDILVSCNYNGKELNAVKKLMVTDIESVRVDFTPSGGKYAIDMENEVYFQAYADIDRTVPIEIENGSVIKLCYSTTEPDVNFNPRSSSSSGSTKGADGVIQGGDMNEEPVADDGDIGEEDFGDEEVGMANQGRILESEIQLNFWDKFFKYFTSMMDEFLNIDSMETQRGMNENQEQTEESGIWKNEVGLKTKAGLTLAKTNNYSKLPQNKYSTRVILDEGVEIKTMIKSNEDGKGSFDLMIEPNCSYYMTVTQSNYYTHFLMVNGDQDFYRIDQSQLRLSVNQRVFESDHTLQATVTKHEENEDQSCRLVIQRNGNIIQEEELTFNACRDENGRKLCDASYSAPIFNLNQHDGGSLTIQIYRKDYFDYPEQESLVFIYPQNVLKIEKQFDKTLYMPGDTVEMDLKIDDADSNGDYFYRVIVSDESAFLQLEKRNLPSTLITKVFLEKELRGVNGVLPNSHSYINWIFENNSNLLEEEYLMTASNGSGSIKDQLRENATQKLSNLLGNQRWRQLFLTGQEMRNFLQQVGYGYNYYSNVKDYFNLDYWVGCSRHLVYDQNFQGKLETLLPFSTQEIIQNSEWRYGGGVMEGGEIMFDAMPVAEAADFAEDDAMMDEKMMEPEMEEESAANSGMTTTSTQSAPEETGNASTEANNSIELESDAIKENTVFFTSLGWSSTDKVTFTLPQDVSKFRVIVLAISKDGRYGLHTDFVSSEKKFDVNIDYPLYIYGTETVDLEVTLYNNDFENISVTNDFNSESWNVDANNLKRVTFSVPSSELPKTFKFTSSNSESNSVAVTPLVKHGLTFKHSRTFMVRYSEVSTQALPEPIQLPSETVPGSVKMQMVYSPIGAPVILSGYETLIREPFGCFEQTSSTTFPMVILMQYLNLQKDVQNQEKLDEMKFKITTNLTKGVKKLLSFETPTGGFEWFGKSPGHVTLTAYGIWQFIEMNKIGQYVDLDVIDRSLNWLRGKYNSSDAEFTLTKGLDSFGNPPQQISDIYIAFVMTLFDQYQIDYSSIIDPIIFKFEAGSDSSDSYLLSFVGLLYENLGKKDKANGLTSRLIQNQNTETGEFGSVESTITLSSGKSKAVEATAMAILFLIKNDSGQYLDQIEKAVDFLVDNMSFGYWYSTQATVLALKAIVRFSEYMTAVKAGQKTFKVRVDSVEKDYQIDISDDPNAEYEALKFEEFESTQLTQVQVTVTPDFTLEPNSKYMFSFEYEYGTSDPLSAQNSPLSVEMNSQSLDNAEQYSIKVSNSADEKQGMVNVVFYKPSGLKVNLNDLETLRKTGKIDYYELLNQNSEVVFYWRGIGAKASYTVDLTLAKEFEISQSFPAKVAAYLYYDKDGSIIFA